MIKKTSLSNGKLHRNKPCNMSESEVTTILLYFIFAVTGV